MQINILPLLWAEQTPHECAIYFVSESTEHWDNNILLLLCKTLFFRVNVLCSVQWEWKLEN